MNVDTDPQPRFQLPTTQQIEGFTRGKGLPMHEPETTAGRYAQLIGEFIPLTMMGPHSPAKGCKRSGAASGPSFGKEKAGRH